MDKTKQAAVAAHAGSCFTPLRSQSPSTSLSSGTRNQGFVTPSGRSTRATSVLSLAGSRTRPFYSAMLAPVRRSSTPSDVAIVSDQSCATVTRVSPAR